MTKEKDSIPGPLVTDGYKTKHDGLDFTNLDHTTAAEIAAFRAATAYTSRTGQSAGHAGLSWWLDQDSDFAASVLKRYRLFVHSTFNEDRSNLIAKSPSMLAFYSLLGYESGLGYILRRFPQQATKEETLEYIAISFIFGGPAGMERIAELWPTLSWPEAPPAPAVYPRGWGADPEAFRSGLDFSSPGLTSDEVSKLEAWYLHYAGEVPPYVRLLTDLGPQILKDYRNRYENLTRRIPKQVVPISMLHFSVYSRSPIGVRENIQLARGFGVSRDYVVALLQNGVGGYGGIEALSMVEQEAGDVLRSWGS